MATTSISINKMVYGAGLNWVPVTTDTNPYPDKCAIGEQSILIDYLYSGGAFSDRAEFLCVTGDEFKGSFGGSGAYTGYYGTCKFVNNFTGSCSCPGGYSPSHVGWWEATTGNSIISICKKG